MAKIHIILFLSVALLFSCKKEKFNTIKNDIKTDTIVLKYATGFKVIKHLDFTEVKVNSAWPGADKEYVYVVAKNKTTIPKSLHYDAFIKDSIQSIVATATAHIPQLELLNIEQKLVGFPTTDYISSPKTRALVDQGKVTDLGVDVAVNLEKLIALKPDLYIGFTVDGTNKTIDKIEKFNIPVVLNGGWAEEHPLGKVEWLKFTGALTNNLALSEKVFDSIEQNYLDAKKIALTATSKPSILCGSTFKDIWNMPKGESWAAKFLSDANANYLWKDTKGTGSLKLNIETVLEKAQHADFWIIPSLASTKEELLSRNIHYQQFDAFKKSNVYLANKKGPTGGLIFYELAPSKPDIILKDLIKIIHPELLPEHELFFYSKIK